MIQPLAGFYVRAAVIAAGLFITAHSALAQSGDVLMAAVDVQQQANQKGRQSQQKIDQLSSETREMLEEYRALLRELRSVEEYNAQMSEQTKAQRQKIDSAQRQLHEIAITRQEIKPFMQTMLENLERFVSLDLPFHEIDRKARVEHARNLLTDPDADDARRFREILQAYQKELDYGRTMSSYRGEIEVDGKQQLVEFLRVGRLALAYQTLDRSSQGYWDPAEANWKKLPDSFRRSISDGIRMAKEEMAPDLISMPVPAPEEI